MAINSVVLPSSGGGFPAEKEFIGIETVGGNRQPVNGAIGLVEGVDGGDIEDVAQDEGIGADQAIGPRNIWIVEALDDSGAEDADRIMGGRKVIGPEQLSRVTRTVSGRGHIAPDAEVEARLGEDENPIGIEEGVVV